MDSAALFAYSEVRRLRNVKARHFQFPMDARRTSGRVLDDHMEDELPQFSADGISSHVNPTTRKPGPMHRESDAVPANNRLRLNQDQRLLPSTPQSSKDHPKQSVRSGNSRLRTSSAQDPKTLPKRRVLHD
jgi:hypothetical protein